MTAAAVAQQNDVRQVGEINQPAMLHSEPRR